MDSSLLIATGASFVIGVTGYIIVRFWIKPIARYTSTKRKLNRELNRYLERMDNTGPGQRKTGHQRKPGLKDARKYTLTLVSCYNEEIPYWYRLLLDSRGESPADALALITGLSKTNNPEQIKNRIDRIYKKIGLIR